MKKNKIIIIMLLLLLNFGGVSVFSQNAATNSGGQVQTVQPKIMLIPYTKEGEDIRTILEADVTNELQLQKSKSLLTPEGLQLSILLQN